MNPRGRWRRSRNLRRVPTTEEAEVGERAQIMSLRCSLRSKTPLLDVFFLDIAFKIVSGRLENAPRKKKHRHTHTQTDKIEPISRSAGSRFQTLETLLPLGEALKRGSRIKLQIPLTSRLMGTSGFLGRWHSPQIAPAAQKLLEYQYDS